MPRKQSTQHIEESIDDGAEDSGDESRQTIDDKKCSKPLYMMPEYAQMKVRFNSGLDEFDVSRFTFTEWSKIRNRYLKQYLLLDFVKREVSARHIDMRHASKLFEFIQSNLNSKTIKPSDIVLENNVIKTIIPLVVDGSDFIIESTDAEDASDEKQASIAAPKIPLMCKLWARQTTKKRAQNGYGDT